MRALWGGGSVKSGGWAHPADLPGALVEHGRERELAVVVLLQCVLQGLAALHVLQGGERGGGRAGERRVGAGKEGGGLKGWRMPGRWGRWWEATTVALTERGCQGLSPTLSLGRPRARQAGRSAAPLPPPTSRAPAPAYLVCELFDPVLGGAAAEAGAAAAAAQVNAAGAGQGQGSGMAGGAPPAGRAGGMQLTQCPARGGMEAAAAARVACLPGTSSSATVAWCTFGAVPRHHARASRTSDQQRANALPCTEYTQTGRTAPKAPATCLPLPKDLPGPARR